MAAGTLTARARANRIAPLVLPFLAVLMIGCEEDPTSLGDTPASAVAASDTTQTGEAGADAAAAPSVRVTDRTGLPLAGIPVTFSVIAGGGEVIGSSPRTGTDGRAAVERWRLGPGIGDNVVVAAIEGLPPIRFVATGRAGPPARIEIIAGDAQTAVAGAPLPTRLAVRVTDRNGNAVQSGTGVMFAVTEGAGTAAPATASTDATGRAETVLTTGGTAGRNAVRASVQGVTQTVQFTATGTAGPAASLRLVSGNAQTGVAGEVLAQPIIVEVIDANGNPVGVGTIVRFEALGTSPGAFGPLVATTDATGRARAQWRLGPNVGPNTGTASLQETGNPVALTATGSVGAPAVLTMVSGDVQVGVAGYEVEAAIVVRATDANGNPMGAGVSIQFDGTGTFTPATAVTDATGTAQTRWSLSTTAGPNAGRGHFGGGAGAVLFSATGMAGAPASLTLVSGNGQTAPVSTALPSPLVVQVADVYGNAVGAGAAVSFAVTSGGGSLAPTSATTNSGGQVQAAWTMGPLPVPQSALASLPALPAASVAFSATATVGPPASIVIISGDAQTGTAGQALAAALVVEVRDALNNPVGAGIAVTFSVTAGGGSVSPGATSTNASGRAQTSWTQGLIAGAGSARGTLVATSGFVTFTATAAAPPFTVVSATTHTCGFATWVYCWGLNNTNQLGDGTTTDRFVPTPVAGTVQFVQVAAGANHSCGLTSTGQAYCWGLNSSGQLGDGTTTQRSTPTLVSGGITFAMLSAGSVHTCGITAAGAAWCWGSNGNGRLGDGTNTQRHVPTAVSGGLTWSTITTGNAHTCAVETGGAARCWGNNTNGRLGDGTTTQRLTPTLVSGGFTWVTIAAGATHTCGIVTGGSARCWGNNANGRLGDGTTTQRTVPTAVSGGFTYTAISAGGSHTCALSAGVARCWGLNSNGRLGDGTTTQRLTPTAVSGGLTFTSIVAGSSHGCGTTAGTLYCWGLNTNGRLGDGTTTQRLVPTAVIQP